MKKRYIYTLLFLVPGFFVSVLIIGILFAILGGALWIFVYGDDPWPRWTETILPAFVILAFAALWLSIATFGYFTGRRLETSPNTTVRHTWISLGATILPIMFIALHQLSVGNLGPKTDTRRCSEYCRDLGFDTSGLPPEISGERVCDCFDQRGERKATVPIDDLPR